MTEDMKVETTLRPEITGQFSDLPLDCNTAVVPNGLVEIIPAPPMHDSIVALWAETEVPGEPKSPEQVAEAALLLIDQKRQRIRTLERQLDAQTVSHQAAQAGAKTIRDILTRLDGVRAKPSGRGVFYPVEIAELELAVLHDLAKELSALTA